MAPSISVIMPALNEELNVRKAVRSTLASLDRLKVEGEVIVVDDGSADQTKEITRRLLAEDARIRLLEHPKTEGIGASFFDGVKNAKMDFVVMLPGDNENDPDEILRYLHIAGYVDIIIPFVCNKFVRSYSRRVVSFLYRTLVNFSFGISLQYTNGTVIYNRSVLNEVNLRSKGFFYQTELLVKLIRLGYLFAEVPVLLSGRRGGGAKAISIRSALSVLGCFIRLMSSDLLNRILNKSLKEFNPASVTHKRMTAISVRGIIRK